MNAVCVSERRVGGDGIGADGETDTQEYKIFLFDANLMNATF